MAKEETVKEYTAGKPKRKGNMIVKASGIILLRSLTIVVTKKVIILAIVLSQKTSCSLNLHVGKR